MGVFIGGLIAGGLVSWGITHWYYLRANQNQKLVFDKLSEELKSLILADKRSNLSVKDLNALLRDTVIDESSSDPLPYKLCPKCGSANIYPSKDVIVDTEMGDDGTSHHRATPYKTIQCWDCGWRDDEIARDVERIKR